MQIKRLRIENFRSIRSLELELSTTTVFIGPNNAGKSAILEAVRIALTRRWGQRGTGFIEYDVHLPDATSDPKTSPPVLIEVELQEDKPDQWPGDLRADLDDIVQLDPSTGRASIILRVSCRWNTELRSFEPRWEFLNAARMPLAGRAARATNLQDFFQYVPFFYLDALRDADDEFSNRSQFWGRLLRSVTVPEELEKRSQRVFDLLNQRFLAADPRLGTIAAALCEISDVASADEPGEANLRMMPLRPWDLLSRAEIIYRNEVARPWLPLSRHGQGVQSLSVVFLFKAFVEQLLSGVYRPDSQPVLALEEPETHLHPQATRTLWSHVNSLPGQKLVTTHSPYFLQKVPFRDLRLVRYGGGGTSVVSLPRTYSSTIPHTTALDTLLQACPERLTYDHATGTLTATGAIGKDDYRALLSSFTNHADPSSTHAELRRLYERSQSYVTDDELQQLETFARRVRGEILFAHRWLLVEGQTEYFIAHALGDALDYNLDSHGVAVIDFQNNGSPSCFAALARALSIPWRAVFDSDSGGMSYMTQIQRRGFEPAEVSRRCTLLTAGTIEDQLVAEGLQSELRAVLLSLGQADVETLNDDALIKRLKGSKTSYAAALAQRITTDVALAHRMPEAFRLAITSLRGLT